MGRRRGRQDLVRAGEVAAVVPAAADRDAGRHPAVADLRGSGFLSEADTLADSERSSGVGAGFKPAPTISPAALKSALVREARALGFDVVGVTRPDAIPLAAQRLQQFLAAGAHGDMDWMATTAARRGSPRALWPDVRSVIMLGLNYGQG